MVQGIVEVRKGENPSEVIAALKDKIADIQQNSLPEDVRIVPFYDRENLVDLAVHTVTRNLIEGILLVTFIVLIFMADWRTTVVVSIIISVGAALCFHLPPGDGDECEPAVDGGDRLRHHYRRGGRDGRGAVCRTRQESPRSGDACPLT